jgi:transposase
MVSRRRRYSAEEKKVILAEASAPGSTVSEVSRRHHITRSLIHNWRRQEAATLLGATVRFTPPVALSEAQLSMLLEGIDWRRPERTWRPERPG